MRDLVCLTFPGPFDCFQADSCQFFDDGRLLLSCAGGCCGCGEVLGGIGTLRVGGGEMGTCSGRLARMLEDAKVDRFLMRLNAPRDGIVGVDVDPAYKIRLRRELVNP